MERNNERRRLQPENASTSTHNSSVSEDDQSFAKASVARECEVQNATQVKSPAEIAGGDILIVQSETFRNLLKTKKYYQ